MKTTTYTTTGTAEHMSARSNVGRLVNEAGVHAGLTPQITDSPRLRILERRSARWARRIAHS